MPNATLIEEVRERLLDSPSTVVLTGAGVSAESGVPTFRGSEGLWNNFRAEDLATPQAFARDPALVWQWYCWRRSKLGGLRPNPAHYALRELEERSSGFTLITQNVDGLHKLAGSAEILELHGNIWRTRCTGCKRVEERRDDFKGIPYCECGAMLRPDIVWFGESLPEGTLTRAIEAVDGAKVMMVAGTSSVVQPAASLALRAGENGAYLIEINPEQTPLSGAVDACLTGPAGEILPQLL